MTATPDCDFLVDGLRALKAGLGRPIPIDPANREPLVDPADVPSDGGLNEQVVREWAARWPWALCGVLMDNGSIQTCDGTSYEEEAGKVRRLCLKRDARMRTDVGNAARFVLQWQDWARYCPAWGKWLLWNQRRWRPDEVLEAMKLAKATAASIFDDARDTLDDHERDLLAKWAAMSQRRDRLAAMLDLAKCELAVRPDQLDADPWLFNCKNGTLDTRSGALRAHRRDDLLTKISPVAYDPGAASPRWDRFLAEVFAGDRELIGFVQRLCGTFLTGDTSEQVLPIFWGDGANGKSVCTETVMGVLGDYACKAPPLLLTTRSNDEHPTEIADLCGRRLVVASESEQGRRLRIGLVKEMTGDRTLKGRYMRQDYFEFPVTHKVVLVTNHRPKVTDDSHAAWRRIRLVPFTVTIPPERQDRRLAERLRAEWPGVLRWMVEGCAAWLREGTLGEPEVVTDATHEYKVEQDSVAGFLDDQCVHAPLLWAAAGQLWTAYVRWCKDNGERWPLQNPKEFAQRLLAKGLKPDRRTVAGRRVRVWLGVALGAPGASEEDHK